MTLFSVVTRLPQNDEFKNSEGTDFGSALYRLGSLFGGGKAPGSRGLGFWMSHKTPPFGKTSDWITKCISSLCSSKSWNQNTNFDNSI